MSSQSSPAHPIGKEERVPLVKVISGGQTGVDRAALDIALERGLACGGWCPAGRRAEDGRIPDRYPLREAPSSDYEQRTEWNVWDSDGTLAITQGPPGGGTAYTLEIAAAVGRPHLVVDLEKLGGEEAMSEAARRVRRWIAEHDISILNVAGPRASKHRDIHRAAAEFLRRVL